MTKASVCVDVPNEIIDAQIRESVSRALGANPEKLIKAVVDEAMKKKKSSYDRETIFMGAVNSMIREAGKEAFREWLDEKKEDIKAAVSSRIRDDDEFIDNIANKLTDGLSSSFHVSIYLKGEDC